MCLLLFFSHDPFEEWFLTSLTNPYVRCIDHGSSIVLHAPASGKNLQEMPGYIGGWRGGGRKGHKYLSFSSSFSSSTMNKHSSDRMPRRVTRVLSRIPTNQPNQPTNQRTDRPAYQPTNQRTLSYYKRVLWIRYLPLRKHSYTLPTRLWFIRNLSHGGLVVNVLHSKVHHSKYKTFTWYPMYVRVIYAR